MYWSCLWSLIFFSISVIVDILAKLLTLETLFSTAGLVAEPLIFGILPTISVTFVLKSVFESKLFTLGIFFQQ